MYELKKDITPQFAKESIMGRRLCTRICAVFFSYLIK